MSCIQPRLMEWGSVYPNRDYDVSATMTIGDSGNDEHYLAARIQDSNNMYVLEYNTTDSQIYKNVGGVWTAIGPAMAGVANASVVTLRVIEDKIMFIDDGVIVRTFTDNSISGAGRAGIGAGNIGASAADMAAQIMDNFVVDTYITISGTLFTDDTESTGVGSGRTICVIY